MAHGGYRAPVGSRVRTAAEKPAHQRRNRPNQRHEPEKGSLRHDVQRLPETNQERTLGVGAVVILEHDEHVPQRTELGLRAQKHVILLKNIST